MSQLEDELKRRQTKILVNGLELNKESSLPSNEKFRKGKNDLLRMITKESKGGKEEPGVESWSPS